MSFRKRLAWLICSAKALTAAKQRRAVEVLHGRLTIAHSLRAAERCVEELGQVVVGLTTGYSGNELIEVQVNEGIGRFGLFFRRLVLRAGEQDTMDVMVISRRSISRPVGRGCQRAIRNPTSHDTTNGGYDIRHYRAVAHALKIDSGAQGYYRPADDS